MERAIAPSARTAITALLKYSCLELTPAHPACNFHAGEAKAGSPETICEPDLIDFGQVHSSSVESNLCLKRLWPSLWQSQMESKRPNGYQSVVR